MSYDEKPIEEKVSVFEYLPEPYVPLTYKERKEMKALSISAYGVSSKWNSLLNKGELKPTVSMTSDGNPIEVKRLYYFTIAQIKAKMEQIVNEREEAQKAAELAKKEDENKNAVD